MAKIEKIIEFSPRTLDALEELAKITGAKNGVAELIQDALRVYEWIIYQQMQNFHVVPLAKNEFQKLDLPDQREILPDLIERSVEGKEQAKKYFIAAA